MSLSLLVEMFYITIWVEVQSTLMAETLRHPLIEESKKDKLFVFLHNSNYLYLVVYSKLND